MTIKAILFDLGGVCAGSPFQAILEYERTHSLPIGYINHCISHSKPDGAWHRLERGELNVGQEFFDHFTKNLNVPSIWDESVRRSSNGFPSSPPPISGEALFWKMIEASQMLDPNIYPALLRLRQTGNYIIAALSNTIILPPSSPHHSASSLLASDFDVYISSAHVGFRKPEQRIFELAISSIDSYARRTSNRVDMHVPRGWAEGVQANEVVFLDDIGENCKAGREAGLRTIKVNLGRTNEAVKELEGILRIDGVKL